MSGVELMSEVTHKPRVSFVIPHFRGEKILSDCLSSVFRQVTSIPYEVIVVDDCSDDGSAKAIQAAFPRVDFVMLSRNRGPAAAKNRGAEKARGDFIAFLDNDVEIEREWLDNMFGRLSEEREQVGLCASHILLNGFDSHINSTGGMINLLGYAWDRGIFSADCNCYSSNSPLMFACSAAMLVRRDVFEELGGFDERYRYPFEDADFGWRMNVLGYRVIYEPNAIARHHLSSTMGRDTHRQIYLYERNRIRALLKNMDGSTLRWMSRELPFHLRERLKIELRRNMLSLWDRFLIFLRFLQAVGWNAVYLPETLSLRKELDRSRKRSDWELIAEGVLSSHIGNPPIEELDLRLMQGEVTQRQEIRHAHPPGRIRMGRDDVFLGSGWHLLECNESGIKFRWTSEKASLYLRRSRSSRSLVVRTLMANPGEYSRLSVSIGGNRASTFEIPNRPHTQKIPLPQGIAPGPCRVELEIGNPFVPRDVLGIMDMRVLGIAVSSIEIS
jgi:GT2 family glycosyltransferase